MGIISKEGYRGKREWAAKRMEQNKKIETLTEEQHNLLAELCTFRHDLHHNWDSAWNEESQNFDKFANNINLLLEVDPQYGIHKAVKSLKGYTSRCLRCEFPSLHYGLNMRETAFKKGDKIGYTQTSAELTSLKKTAFPFCGHHVRHLAFIF